MQTDALRGSIDLLVLETLSLEPMHGWGISRRIQQLSSGALDVNQGSLYPALQRLEKDGLIKNAWGTTGNNRRARYYRLTRAGRRARGPQQPPILLSVGSIAIIGHFWLVRSPDLGQRQRRWRVPGEAPFSRPQRGSRLCGRISASPG